MPKGRPKKYLTPEDKLEADRKRKREWASKNKKKITYAERIEKMTPEQYARFLEKERIKKRMLRAKQKMIKETMDAHEDIK
jgi:hypothetical protein